MEDAELDGEDAENGEEGLTASGTPLNPKSVLSVFSVSLWFNPLPFVRQLA